MREEGFLCFIKDVAIRCGKVVFGAAFLLPVFLFVTGGDSFADTTAGENFQQYSQWSVFTVNNLWVLLAAMFVFIMHLGFGCIESGLARSKNTVNILFKNVMIIAIGFLTYAFCGFNLMYPGFAEGASGFFGFGGFWISAPEGNAGLVEYASGSYSYYTDFMFQAMFAATAATIVSGAVVERIKLLSFIIFAIFYVSVVYPIAGSWLWGGGWLSNLGFYDFAGSTIVHSIGGWGALIGTLFVGPRIGKYINGKTRLFQGHNMPLATIGALLLWFGWYGFNGGSVLSADPAGISQVFVTTSLSASAGVASAMVVMLVLKGKPDLTMVLNGALAGLVGITAGANVISPGDSVIVGMVAGVLVVGAVIFLDRVRVDDPIGAIPVHLFCGIWGTLAVGIFSSDPNHTFIKQLIGVSAIGVFSAIGAAIIFFVIKMVLGLRVSAEEEVMGLDLGEHGMEAYDIH